MTRVIEGILLLLSSSLAASILAKATLIATLGLIGARLTRRSPAAVRHAVLAASLAVMLALPVASVLINPVRISLSASTQEWAPLSLFPANNAAPPTSATNRSVAISSAAQRWRGLSPSALLLAVWIAGMAFFLFRMIFGLQQVRILRQYGLPWPDGQSVVNQLAVDAGIHRRVELLLHESLPAPVTCGFVRPAIVLPTDTQSWHAEDLDRAIVDELEHVRRFDWASHCLARLACSVYWFHPLVWIARRQFELEAERSCDDAVLLRSEATAYADQLVGLARRLSTAHKSPALAMANRSDLSARVRSVLDAGKARGRAGALLVAIACAVAVAIVLTVSPLRVVAAPGAIASVPKWDAVSIKRCTSAPVAPKEVREAGNPSPGSQTWSCVSASTLINQAYSIFAGQSKTPPYPAPIERLPAWANSERYTIDAIPHGRPGVKTMRGPMLQALLEDRFALKIRRETRVARVYLMTVANGGPKLPEFEGGCTPVDFVHLSSSPTPNPCRESSHSNGPNVTIDIPGLDLDSFAAYITRRGRFDGPVFNRTNLTGAFHFHLEFQSDAPSVITARQQQLGLHMEPSNGPRDFLVVDRLEKPAEN
jgi:bla regulator protein BlaR1